MSLPSPAGETQPDRAGKLAAILSIQPNDSQPLTQFSAEQQAAYEWAVRWIHDFNLGRRPKPDFPVEVLGRLSDFHGTQMNEYLRQQKPTAPALTDPGPPVQPEFNPEPVGAHAPTPADHQPVEPDPEAEWSQRVLAGMKRMTEDPEYRASIEKRIS